jgi:hypothetical protein
MRASIGMPQLAQLAGLARGLLSLMRSPESGLYSHKAHLVNGRVANKGENALYSAISLVGSLHDGEMTQHAAASDPGETLDSLHARVTAGARLSEIGTLVWASALAHDRRADRLVRVTDARLAGASSMEIGLLLSGLVRFAEARPSVRDAALGTAARCATALQERFGWRAGLFRGTSDRHGRDWLLHGRLTSFASQVYPIHGLSDYERVVGIESTEARRAAETIVGAQGPLGQWWWIYHQRTGAVIEAYPVYSVHQDAMAFIALLPVYALGGDDHRPALWRGLEWLLGGNELQTPLVDWEHRFVFRAIQRVGSDPDRFGGMSGMSHARVVGASMGMCPGRAEQTDPDGLEILRECRSYHLGWLLYACSLITKAQEEADARTGTSSRCKQDATRGGR